MCSGRVGFLCKRWTKKLFPLPFAFPSFLSLSLWLFAGCSPLLNMAVSLPVTSDPSFSAQTPSLCPVQARPPSLSSVPDSATHPSRSPFLLWLCFSLFFFPRCSVVLHLRPAVQTLGGPLRRGQKMVLTCAQPRVGVVGPAGLNAPTICKA